MRNHTRRRRRGARKVRSQGKRARSMSLKATLNKRKSPSKEMTRARRPRMEMIALLTMTNQRRAARSPRSRKRSLGSWIYMRESMMTQSTLIKTRSMSPKRQRSDPPGQSPTKGREKWLSTFGIGIPRLVFVNLRRRAFAKRSLATLLQITTKRTPLHPPLLRRQRWEWKTKRLARSFRRRTRNGPTLLRQGLTLTARNC
mmetsp:Transcript_35327/g.74525  ORF Transcript_35327/g.74525 Transcript_35327/m.74525 type:complete len:200 (+) Transcript_35327:1043-1642(+)